ncbi:class I SAM-dependent methyltransferase [Candidatus Villigracilis saccharophilus]|uniref:class I SAM-dependent DNA methyltransferase n=1 Tax=Candidatus Villigracilis saccharophilus TaxID=3140684 RepID=UPI0031346E79|nr:methyltransferase domain-containing protein [Anaerolineales bacterium]
MNQSSRSQLFDNWAKNYDNSITSDKDGFPFAGYERILEQVVSLAEVKPNTRILDLGIGTGNLAERFVNKGCNVHGLDFSAEMLTQTKAKLPQVNLVQANLLDDWTKELQTPFDRVVSAYVFHEFNLETKIRLLQQISAHCLSTSGFILVADIAFPDVAIRTAASQHWQWDEDEYYWAADEAITACEQAGLQVAYQQISSCGGVFTFTSKGAG